MEFARLDDDQLAQVHALAEMLPEMQVGTFPLSKTFFGEAIDVHCLLGEEVKGA